MKKIKIFRHNCFTKKGLFLTKISKLSSLVIGEIRKKAEKIAAKSFFNSRFCGRAGKMRIDIRGFEYYNINTYKK